MKLNLLPTTEKKSRQGKTAIVLATLIVLGSIAGYGALTFFPAAHLNAVKEPIPDLERQVADADAMSKRADTIIATAAPVLRNAALAQAMIAHNDKYPKLYDDIKRYIPPYFRLQTISATPAGENVTQVRLTGTITGYQRYADLMLALMRFKEATSIQRSNYNLDDPLVPALSPEDQIGKMRRANEAPVPDDQLERLAYFQQQAQSVPTGYLATGNYGSGTNDARLALPDASLITIDMVVSRDLRVPMPSSTLSSGGGGAPAGGGMPPFGGPGGPGSFAGGPGGRPPGMPGGAPVPGDR